MDVLYELVLIKAYFLWFINWGFFCQLVSSVRDMSSGKEVSDDARCYSVFLSSHDLVYSQNSSSFPRLILVNTDNPAYTNCWSSRGIQGHWPSSFYQGFGSLIYIQSSALWLEVFPGICFGVVDHQFIIKIYQ